MPAVKADLMSGVLTPPSAAGGSVARTFSLPAAETCPTSPAPFRATSSAPCGAGAMFSGSCPLVILNSTNVCADSTGGAEACVNDGPAATAPTVTAIPKTTRAGTRKRLIFNLSSSRLAAGAPKRIRIYEYTSRYTHLRPTADQCATRYHRRPIQLSNSARTAGPNSSRRAQTSSAASVSQTRFGRPPGRGSSRVGQDGRAVAFARRSDSDASVPSYNCVSSFAGAASIFAETPPSRGSFGCGALRPWASRPPTRRLPGRSGQVAAAICRWRSVMLRDPRCYPSVGTLSG